MKLDPNNIDLWYVDASNFKYRDLLMLTSRWLSKTESQRLARLKLPQHKHEFLLGRYMLRSILSLYGSVLPQDWVFEYNKHGKPFIAKAQQATLKMPLYFNLSHSKGKLILALARYEKLGIDIECGTKPRRIKKISNRYFSRPEVESLELLPENAQQTRFYDLWSLKEAYIKACGLGLAIPLADFSYRLSNAGGISIDFSPERQDVPEQWQFWQIGSVPCFHVAVAVKSAHAEHLELANFFELMPLGVLKPMPLILQRSSYPA
ncbi:MAG: 4'-phosphopantetheinyl transferase superfamily protein [Pseudohongiellaceae bacterium]